jgi:hypothetical protein
LPKNNKNPLLTGWETKPTKPTIKVPKDSDHGVDWVNLRIGLDPSSIDLSSPIWTVNHNGKLPDPDITYDAYYAKIPFGQTFVDAAIYIDSMRLFLRFNPSAALYGKSKSILPADALEPLIGKLLDECYEHFVPEFDHVDDQGTISRDPQWAEKVWISRLDCARNLQIKDHARFKKAIEKATPRNMKTKYVYDSGINGWGVVNKTKSVGQERLYDKDVELALHDADEILSHSQGTCFRFETQLQSDRLDKFGLRHLANVSAESVWRVIEERWKDCRWDVTFAEPGTAAKAMKYLSSSEKTGLLGYLGKHQLGFQDEITVSATRKYGSLAKSLGLKPGMPLESQGVATQQVDIYLGAVIDLGEAL